MNPGLVVKHISPMLAVADMNETIAFYSELLGFQTVMHSPEYAILERDGQTIHLKRAWSETRIESVRGSIGYVEIYIEVRDIQTLWNHVKTFKSLYSIRDLFDRDYGMTEFHIVDVNGCLLFVGEPTAK